MNLKSRRGPVTTTPNQTRSGFAKFVLFVTAGVMAIALLAMFSTGWVQDAYGQTVPNPTATPTQVAANCYAGAANCYQRAADCH